jgi:hypothetical protein
VVEESSIVSPEIPMKKSELPYSTDKNGLITGIRYHDGKVIAFSFGEDIGSIHVRDVDGGVVEFELRGLDQWTMEFWDWPIVNDISVWKVESVPPELGGWETLLGSRAKDIEDAAAALIRKNPEAFLFQVDCSYGGALAAVCSHVAVYKILELDKEFGDTMPD